jgi:hypothetical protein
VNRKNNVVANAVSRKPYFCSITNISADWRRSVIIAKSAKNIVSMDSLHGKLQDDRFKVVDEPMLFKDQVYLLLESKVKRI